MSFATAQALIRDADRVRVEGDHRVAQGDLAVELERNAPVGELHVLVRCALGEEARTRLAVNRLRLEPRAKPPKLTR